MFFEVQNLKMKVKTLKNKVSAKLWVILEEKITKSV